MDLPALAAWNRDEPLLDLCGGTGIVSKALLVPQPFDSSPHPRVTLLDLNPRAGEWAEAQEKAGRFRQVPGKANDADLYFAPESFGVVVCRQAMGYLNLNKVMPAVATLLKPGGRFVFNTFMDPGQKPLGFKKYRMNDRQFVEAHLAVFDRVIHLQAKMPPHSGIDVTLFKYHSEKAIRKAAAPWFKVECSQKGRSYHWRLTRLAKGMS